MHSHAKGEFCPAWKRRSDSILGERRKPKPFVQQSCVSTNCSDRSLIDETLPRHQFSATYRIGVNAAPAVVYRSLLHTNFHDLWLVRLLMSVRSAKVLRRSLSKQDLRRQLEATGFMVLAEVPDEEIVIGIVGRFWRPDGGRRFDLLKEDFGDFHRPGFTKAAWNFKLRPRLDGGTILSTETRVECFGRAALWKFGAYWSVIAPFSGLIRKAILKQIKAEAESNEKHFGDKRVVRA